MPDDAIEKRARELEETLKGRAKASSPETVAGPASPRTKGTVAEVITKAQCRTCLQEVNLQPGQAEWRCEVCNTLNRL